METIAHINENSLNNHSYLNLKNGLLNLNTLKLEAHSSLIYSTIQLKVTYNPSSTCLKWLKTLSEIFENSPEIINLLQEFFGLCLTPESKFEKALILLGEGANGKSLLLFILQKILGEDNYSSIPLEKFNNLHYLANLFGKLANISIETSAKSEVYDGTFKAVTSGDDITVDHKFGKPFKFRPFSKLILAANNMPRVDDKTDGFFRKLIIIRIKKRFSEKEQNKNLKFELLDELDGIFFWMLQGWEQLRKRGYFDLPLAVKQEIEEYRVDNNTTLAFLDEKSSFRADYTVLKGDLYAEYSSWCALNGYFRTGKRKFGKELQRHFPQVTEDKLNKGHTWIGLTINKGA